jgi:hypothetical protein
MVAGAFLNLEPLVGARVGVAAFGDPAGLRLRVGAAVIIGGIALSSLPALRTRSRTRQAAELPAVPAVGGNQPEESCFTGTR